MCLIEEEHQLRLVDVTDLGQVGEQIGQYPHQKRREHHRPRGLVAEFEESDDAAALRVEAQQVGRFDFRLAEERVTAFGLEVDQRAQDHPGGLRGHPTDRLQLHLALVTGQVGDHRPQILEVQQWQALLIGPVEDQAEGGLLSLVEAQHLREQNWPECGDRRAHRNPDAAGSQREELHRERRSHPVVAGLFGPLGGSLVRLPRPGQPGQVALEVGHHHRYTRGGQLLGDHLQGLGLTGSRGAGNQAVAVHHRQRDPDLRRRIHLTAHHNRTQFQGRTGGGVAGGDLLSGRARRFGHSPRDYCARRGERG